jgi:hypothetical protein
MNRADREKNRRGVIDYAQDIQNCLFAVPIKYPEALTRCSSPYLQKRHPQPDERNANLRNKNSF